MLCLNSIKGASRVPGVGQSRSGRLCSDDIAADVNNTCDVFVQVLYSRQQGFVGLMTCNCKVESLWD